MRKFVWLDRVCPMREFVQLDRACLLRKLVRMLDVAVTCTLFSFFIPLILYMIVSTPTSCEFSIFSRDKGKAFVQGQTLFPGFEEKRLCYCYYFYYKYYIICIINNIIIDIIVLLLLLKCTSKKT
jgi:hypothetical protein